MEQNPEFVIVSTTVDSEAKAEELAASLVERRLAACVHLVPIRSAYRWKGNIESASEYLLNAKTRSALIQEALSYIRQVHTYEVPEIIVTPIVAGYAGYLNWLRQETGG
jgi:periplasmic divalent cation tolerance protein